MKTIMKTLTFATRVILVIITLILCSMWVAGKLLSEDRSENAPQTTSNQLPQSTSVEVAKNELPPEFLFPTDVTSVTDYSTYETENKYAKDGDSLEKSVVFKFTTKESVFELLSKYKSALENNGWNHAAPLFSGATFNETSDAGISTTKKIGKYSRIDIGAKSNNGITSVNLHYIK